jgi:hypothetical protein
VASAAAMIAVAAQVAVGGARAADADRLVGQGHMQRAGVGIGMDRDGGDAHPAGGAR